jgi:hypothetical protein
MNHESRLKLLALSLIIFVGAVSTYSSRMLPSPSLTESDKTDSTLSTLSKYRTWTLVNPAPVKMESAVAERCAAVVVRQSPHQDKYLSVYVNETGREAMMTQLRPEFPRGSMIVKEKLSERGSRSPELLTAMIKREAGYNPESGDWEYLVLDGTASKITKQGKLDSCNSCHMGYPDTDYVTRAYLSDEVRRQLR